MPKSVHQRNLEQAQKRRLRAFDLVVRKGKTPTEASRILGVTRQAIDLMIAKARSEGATP